jgi:hypothetical protein
MSRSGKPPFWVTSALAVTVALCAFAGPAQAGSKGVPSLASPAADAATNGVPAFSWKAARRAAKYEFQLAADPNFESIVIGEGYGSFQTRNTFATVNETLPNDNYFWRVRSINPKEDASKWSSTRKFRKSWSQQPALISPVKGEAISYPLTPLVLHWNPVPGAYKYLVWIGTDPSLASVDKPIETVGTVLAPTSALGPGRYYWAVTPLDAQDNIGRTSAVGSFVWQWPSRTTPRLFDLNANSRVLDPQFSWPAVPGAARYEVEVNPSRDFAVGSKVCCGENVIGTSLSPKEVLPNNSYYWRVRAIDLDGQAGLWNYGAPFSKAFDNVAPTIPNLHVRDNLVDRPSDLDPSSPQLDTSYPVLKWDPVPGASSYQVQVAPHNGVCDWTGERARQWDVQTAATAWTPLANSWNSLKPGVTSPSSVSYDPGKLGLQANTNYCARVLARTDRDSKNNQVLSQWTQIGGIGQPAFRYLAPSGGTVTAGPNFTMPAATYVGPQSGTFTPRLPLFTWRPITGAGSYFVVVARDPAFTQVIDIALTNVPMYAPRKGFESQTYPDETTFYYWAVVPATAANGGGAASHPVENLPRTFQKRSVPPALLTPSQGQNVATQPTFRWTSTEGARDYQIQVARDPSFSDLVDDVETAATSYTSEGTYPADTLLYWRVRANDENRVGLTWSQTRTFRRRLPAPQLFADNPTGGQTVPVLRWKPVAGATSYDFHIDQTDQGQRDFDLRGTAATFVKFYGIGTLRWQVRANFPSGTRREITGPYSAPQNFTRRIATPSGLHKIAKDRHVLLQWNPAVMAKDYRVQISPTDSFSQITDRITTDNTSWAPKLTQTELVAGGKMFWRVAAADEGQATGGWAVGKFNTPPGFSVTASGFPRKGEKGVVRVYVRDGLGRGVKKAKVVVSGSRTRRRARRTDKSGVATLPVKPHKRGTLKFRVTKRKFRPGIATLDVY